MPNPEAANTNTTEQKPMTDAQLVTFCEQEISKSIGSGSGGADSDAEITVPLDYYHGRTPKLTKARARDLNASRYVSQDVMDGIESTVAEIMPAFTTDEIGFYEPVDQGDEEKARAESDIVNYLFMEEYDGFTILQTALKDAFLHRNCSGKAFWDERIEVEYETFENVGELALPQLLQPENDKQTIEVVEQEVEEEGNQEAAAALQAIEQAPNKNQEDMQVAQKLIGPAQTKYTIKIKRTTKTGRPVIMNLPPEQVKVKSGHKSVYLHGCSFVAHQSLETQSSLIAQGYDPSIVNSLPDYNSSGSEQSRSRDSDEHDHTSSHRSMREIEVFECYPEIDFDGDGIAERRKVVVSGSKLLSNEEFSSVAIIGGAACIMPHKYKAISMFDRLKDIQDAKTPVMRSVIDGSQLGANPRIGVVTGKANIDDILSSRTGGVVRVDRPDAVFDFPTPQVSQQSYQFLEHMDSVRRDRGGSAVDMSNQVNQVRGNSGDQGLDRIMNSMELGNALSARNIGETFVRGIYLEMHNILRKNWPKGEKISAKIGGNWVETVPSEWRKRTKVTIQVGASIAERARQSGVLSGVIEQQDQMMQTGSIMYDEKKHYAALADRIKLAGIRSPERYFVDPASPEGEKKSQFMSMMKKQMKEKEERVQGIMVEAQKALGDAEKMKAKAANDSNVVKFQNEQMKATIDRLQTELDALAKSGDLQFKYAQLAEETAIKLTEMELAYNTEANARNEANKGATDDDSTET